MRTAIAGLLVASTLAVPAALAVTAAPASATPCDHTQRTTVYKEGTRVWARINGSDSDFNRTSDPITRTIMFGKSDTSTVSKHWEIGASVEGGWGPVKASISGAYGEEYVNSATTSRTESRTMSIRPGHTGWVQVIVYQRIVNWESYSERWNDKAMECQKVVLKKAFWAAPKIQYVAITKKGHRYPA